LDVGGGKRGRGKGSEGMAGRNGIGEGRKDTAFAK